MTPIRCRKCDRVRFDNGEIKYWPRAVPGERWAMCPECMKEANEKWEKAKGEKE